MRNEEQHERDTEDMRETRSVHEGTDKQARRQENAKVRKRKTASTIEACKNKRVLFTLRNKTEGGGMHATNPIHKTMDGGACY